MFKRPLLTGILAAFLFCGGIFTGHAHVAGAANAESISTTTPAADWEKLAQDPAFRAAVIAVINSCLVDNGVIYCD